MPDNRGNPNKSGNDAMKNFLFEYAEIGGGKGAEKKLAQAFSRAGAEVVSTGTDGKTKRTAGVSFKSLMLTFADGQTIEALVKQTGDIYQVKLNGKLIPLKAPDDHKESVKQLVTLLDSGRAKFQAALAKTKVALPAGTKSKAVDMSAQLKAQVEALDTQIAEATTKRDALKAELGDTAMDGVALDGIRDKPVTKRQAEIVDFIKTQINYDLAPHAYFIKNKAIGIDLSENDELDSRMRNIESLGLSSKKFRVEPNGRRNYALILDSADIDEEGEEGEAEDENQAGLFDAADCEACEKPAADCVCDNSAMDSIDKAPDASWHSRTMAAMKTKSDESLRYIIKDAREAAKAARTLGNNAAEGRYEDEAHYAAMELTKRQKAKAGKAMDSVLDSVMVQVTEDGKMADTMAVERFAEKCCDTTEVHGNAHALKLVDAFNAMQVQRSSTRRASLMHIGPKHSDQVMDAALALASVVLDGAKEDPLEVVVREGSKVIMRMAGNDFLKTLRDQGMVRPNTFLADAIKYYNEKNESGFVASHEFTASAKKRAKPVMDGAALDSVGGLETAQATLQIALDAVLTNEPINRAEGNIEQADFELLAAKSFRAALKVLDDAKPKTDGKFVRTWSMK